MWEARGYQSRGIELQIGGSRADIREGQICGSRPCASSTSYVYTRQRAGGQAVTVSAWRISHPQIGAHVCRCATLAMAQSAAAMPGLALQLAGRSLVPAKRSPTQAAGRRSGDACGGASTAPTAHPHSAAIKGGRSANQPHGQEWETKALWHWPGPSRQCRPSAKQATIRFESRRAEALPMQ